MLLPETFQVPVSAEVSDATISFSTKVPLLWKVKETIPFADEVCQVPTKELLELEESEPVELSQPAKPRTSESDRNARIFFMISFSAGKYEQWDRRTKH